MEIYVRKYMEVYEGVWTYMGLYGVYDSMWRYTGVRRVRAPAAASDELMPSELYHQKV